MVDLEERFAITVKECLVLDINQLMRKGLLEKKHSSTYISWLCPETGKELHRIQIEIGPYGHSGLKDMSITHFNTYDKGTAVNDQHLVLEHTELPSGGKRWWFMCPNSGKFKHSENCIDRVGKLYLPPGGRDFACRECHGLTYDSVKGPLAGLLRTSEQIRQIRRDYLQAKHN
jgi:hypothetical protein